ncbi:hypothetical protein EC973_009117 [Apophysomyces ossiformis]|uniref:Major facilitator superfamily (MFS) profile domain-containing protein n=1 Tax=Apophysomyces ossiformis TaxID=679940 RepID=A0A8H7EQI2_9FUNG|nr:hypothetical protein EC973_009117 [Apophysomyces ossiformis]
MDTFRSKPHILIIGGGITGLTTALVMLEKDYLVTILSKQFVSTDATTVSQPSVILWEWSPSLSGPHTESLSSEVAKRWSLIAYERFQTMAEDQKLSDKSGISMQLTNYLFRQNSPAVQHMDEIKDHVKDFRHDTALMDEVGVHKASGVVDSYQFSAPVINPHRYMQWLTNHVKSLGAKMIERTIEADLYYQEVSLLREYGADVLVNCTGLAAHQLATDDTVYPQKHSFLRMVNNGEKFSRISQPIVLFQEEESDTLSIVPVDNDCLLIGKVAEANQRNLNLTLEDHPALQNMYEQVVEFYPSLTKGELDKSQSIEAGLVPFRKSCVRIERDKRFQHGDKLSRIIHNYGQGDAGFTLSFGCAEDVASIVADIVKEDNKLPPKISLFLILMANFLFNVSFYIIIPTVTNYANSLGADDVFSGLVIGGNTLSSIISIFFLNQIPMLRDRYLATLHLACASFLTGNILYALAARAQFLYLIFIGRLINGLGFTGFFFVKRYCTDPRIVGIRRRTLCCSLLVVSQSLGMVIGPLIGGQLARIGYHGVLMNMNTIAGWVMACIWLTYWVSVVIFFQDIPKTACSDKSSQRSILKIFKKGSYGMLVITVVMSFIAFSVFFELGAWEANIPIFTAKHFGWNEWDAGNFIGLIGIGSLVIVVPMTVYSKRIQDRTTAAVGFGTALIGMIIYLARLTTSGVGKADYGVSWFLICSGYNVASTITLSLMSKLFPDKLSDVCALIVQVSNYTGRLTGAVWGTASESVTEVGVASLEIAFTIIGFSAILILWQRIHTVTG